MGGDIVPPPICLLGLYRRKAARTLGGVNGSATASGLELECISLIIDRAGASASGAGTRVAVILALQGYAIAHFHLAGFNLARGHLPLLHHLLFAHHRHRRLCECDGRCHAPNGDCESAGDQRRCDSFVHLEFSRLSLSVECAVNGEQAVTTRCLCYATGLRFVTRGYRPHRSFPLGKLCSRQFYNQSAPDSGVEGVGGGTFARWHGSVGLAKHFEAVGISAVARFTRRPSALGL